CSACSRDARARSGGCASSGNECWPWTTAQCSGARVLGGPYGAVRGRCGGGAPYHPRAVSERPGNPQEPEDAARVQALPAVGEIGPAPEVLTGGPGPRSALARNTAIF